jgi:hypothetical protein
MIDRITKQPFCQTRVSGSFLLRVLLSPFIFLWGLFMLAVGTVFPITLLVMISFVGLLLEPFVWLLKKSGSNINGIEPFIDDTGNNALGHFLGLTIHIWGAFAVVYIYLKDGTVWSVE